MRRINLWGTAAAVLCVSSAIAATLTLQQPDAGLWQEMIASNLIGFASWGAIEALRALSRGRTGSIGSVVVGAPIGIIAGGKAATLLGVPDFVGSWIHAPLQEWRAIGVVLLFALSASAFVVVFAHAAASRLELETEKRQRAEGARSQVVAELALLQAQIEPHFLFNTLAHVHSAIDHDPALGKQILDLLIRYLRGTLSRSRNSHYTLAEERDLVEALLGIAVMRLGSRLRTHLTIADDLATAALPPLLLQPLVENAIEHGIEPSLDGGTIWIEGARVEDCLVLRVTDTGVGMAGARAEGTGLSNVRARLAALYGGRGRLTLHAHPARGTIAELRLPLRGA